jgi:lactoylglutathione lyase
MKATGVSHIAICVRDMDKSLAFYRDALGMKVLQERTSDPSELGARLYNYAHPHKIRRYASLSYGNGATPTLTLTSHPGEKVEGKPNELDHVGITHFAFQVDDVKALAAELVAKGMKLGAPLESFANSKGEIRNVYVLDPDGTLIQLSAPGQLG